ncbi:MAG: ABC transporter ATP-binding protein/permease, partial [Oscillospiraceae bacterium]|nr:ABC transporter ATP-binding protein/permease [Oscillospiraceae bacterium]
KIDIILLVLTPMMMFIMGMLTPKIQKISALDKANDETNRSIMQEDLNRLTLIKAYSMQNKVVEKIECTYKNKLKSGMVLGAWEGFAAFLGALSGNVMSLVTLGLGSYFVLNGETTVGSLIMIVQLLNYIVTPVAKFPAAVAQIGQASASAERIGGIYELPEERGTSSVSSNADELVAENLCFSYSQENILNGIDLSFRKGEVTGIVGKSGSGKSTLLKLLMGLYSPTDGTVYLKCKDKTLSGEDIISQAAYVPPDNYLFSGTLAENIAMSDNERDMEKMSVAAAKANILDYIQSLANGFKTVIGEVGNTVSSGQAQRIAIARAIYKRGKIFIFDEPTANLDKETVEVFQSTVKELAWDNICIIVTHNPSTVEICDKVYTLENGRVIVKS